MEIMFLTTKHYLLVLRIHSYSWNGTQLLQEKMTFLFQACFIHHMQSLSEYHVSHISSTMLGSQTYTCHIRTYKMTIIKQNLVLQMKLSSMKFCLQ